MKIDNSFKGLTTGPIPDETERAPRVRDSAQASSPSSNVSLSAVSSHLQAIEQGFADTPVVNSAHVAELKAAIANGQFKVDAGKVADRLLATVQDLIRAHKG